jgi:hypothetical protein
MKRGSRVDGRVGGVSFQHDEALDDLYFLTLFVF